MRTSDRQGSPARHGDIPAGVSNRNLTASSVRRGLRDQLNRGLGDLIERGQSLGVGFIALLRDDHV
jgi:hypothetical protein